MLRPLAFVRFLDACHFEWANGGVLDLENTRHVISLLARSLGGACPGSARHKNPKNFFEDIPRVPLLFTATRHGRSFSGNDGRSPDLDLQLNLGLSFQHSSLQQLGKDGEY